MEFDACYLFSAKRVLGFKNINNKKKNNLLLFFFFAFYFRLSEYLLSYFPIHTYIYTHYYTYMYITLSRYRVCYNIIYYTKRPYCPNVNRRIRIVNPTAKAVAAAVVVLELCVLKIDARPRRRCRPPRGRVHGESSSRGKRDLWSENKILSQLWVRSRFFFHTEYFLHCNNKILFISYYIYIIIIQPFW